METPGTLEIARVRETAKTGDRVKTRGTAKARETAMGTETDRAKNVDRDGNVSAGEFKASVIACLEDEASEMTEEEYKEFIYDRIAEIPLHPTKKGWNIFLRLSEEGLRAMKEDPSYERWVLDTIRRDFMTSDPFLRDTFEVLSFGATKQEFRTECYSRPGRQEIERMRKECMERKEMLRKKRKKYLAKKRLEEKWRKEKMLAAYFQLKRMDHIKQVEEENRAIFLGEKPQGIHDRSASLYAAARRKVNAMYR